jgi:hypothetical protein
MKSQASTHKRFLIGTGLVLAVLLAWLVVIERAEAGPPQLIDPAQETLPPTNGWQPLPFSGSENRQKWSPGESVGDWLFEDPADYAQTGTTYTNAFSTYEQPVAIDYHFRVKVEYTEATTIGGGGIIFNAPTRDSDRTAYVVRFKDGARKIEWGHFAGDGSFQYQDEATNPSLDQNGQLSFPQNLEVRVQGASYAVLVGEREAPVAIAKDIAFAQNEPSYFGLTTFDAGITFQDAEIWVNDLQQLPKTPEPPDTPVPTATGDATNTPAPTSTPLPTETSTPTPTTTGTPDVMLEPRGNAYVLPLADRNQVQAEWAPINGVWDTDENGGGYRHENVNSQDGITYFGSRINGDYEFTVDFKIEEKGSSPRTGILFNVPNRSVKNGAYVIRYDGDRTLEWGIFNNASIYEPIGSKTYGDDFQEEFHRIWVKVASNHYSIRFNDDGVDNASNALFREGYGRVYHPYIGLYASNSKAIFNRGEVLVSARTTPTATPQATFTPSPNNVFLPMVKN